MLGREAGAVGIEQNAQCGHHRVVVQQRFTLAHEHNVGLRFECPPVVFERHENLPDDLGRGEVPDQAQRRRQAEAAIDWATRLRRDANGLAAFLRHENGLDGCGLHSSGVQREQVARRAVRGTVAPLDVGQGDRGFPRQASAQRRGQVRHRGEVQASLGVQRMVDLYAAVGRLALRSEPCAQLFRRFSEQFHLHLRAPWQDSSS